MGKLTHMLTRWLGLQRPAPVLPLPDEITAPAPAVANDPSPEPVIRKAAVIGAGVMGAGIAAQLANAGLDVILLDKMPGAADNAIKRMLKASPATDPMNAGLMHPDHAARISTGTTDADMDKIRDADWIIEAVPEILSIKQDTFHAIDQHRKPGSIVSSNTSTIPLATLTAGMDPAFRSDFMITHFFNPVRFMDLLELVPGTDTRPDAVGRIRDIGSRQLGKSVVETPDTPGFIANRIGSFLIQRALAEAVDTGRTIEEIDAALGKPVGFPKDGIFGLMDIVGLDLAPKVAGSLAQALPAADAFHQQLRPLPALDQLIATGRTGRKSRNKEGFYRVVTAEDGARQKQVVDLATGDYRPRQEVCFASASAGRKGLRPLIEQGDAGSVIAWNVLRDTLAYAADILPELGGDIHAIDTAMRTGYNWKRGPFEMIDAMGADWFTTRLQAEGHPVPALLAATQDRPLYADASGAPARMTMGGHYRPIERAADTLSLDDLRRKGPPLSRNGSASLWDAGDGVLCVELHGMKETLDPDSLDMLGTALDTVTAAPDRHKALLICSGTRNFAVGANLGLAARIMNMGHWDMLDDVVGTGQQVMQRIKYAPVPVVGAVSGLALGGGCEILLHCAAIQAHAESYIGLVETGVGLVPGWGGCKEYLLRAQAALGDRGPMHFVTKAFETIMRPDTSVSSSAHMARHNLFLREGDGISMNRHHLLADAKALALKLAPGYQPPQPGTLYLPGPEGKAAIDMAIEGFHAQGSATWHDVRVAEALARVLTGGETFHLKPRTETDILQLEREAFIRLAKTAQSRARIRHTINTGKPLREGPLTEPATIDDLRNSLPAHTPKARTITLLEAPPSPAAAAPAADLSEPDVRGMKPMEAMVHLLRHGRWLPPAPNADPALNSAFNDAARQTKQGTLERLSRNKGLAALMPAGVVRDEIVSGLSGSLTKAESKLEKASDPAERMRLSASVAVLSHYRDVARKLTV